MTSTTMSASGVAPRGSRSLRQLASLEPALFVAASVLLLIVGAVVLGPLFLPSPAETAPFQRLRGPSPQHLLGTDGYGRDVLSRLVSGGRGSLGLVVCVTVGAVGLGTIIGLVSGYFRRIGSVVMRLMDAWLAFPSVILAMVLAVSFGAGFGTELVALVIVFTPATARVIRSRVLAISQRTYVEAARSAGVGSGGILLRHILPNVLALALVQAVIIAAAAMLVDGALSFLGLGIAPPTPTWGNMIAEGQATLRTHPLLIIMPGLAIATCVVLLNVIGGSLRSVVDPRHRSLRDLQRAQARRGRRRNGHRVGAAAGR